MLLPMLILTAVLHIKGILLPGWAAYAGLGWVFCGFGLLFTNGATKKPWSWLDQLIRK